MSNTPTCILKMKQAYPTLNGKYRDIADYILASPERIISEKVRDIARACKCDDSQVIRFCKKVGYDGFAAMRTSMATEFMPVGMGPVPDRSDRDAFGRMRREFLENHTRVLNDTVNLIDKESVVRATDILRKAKTTYLLGTGASGVVAMDAHFKLQRLGYNSRRFADTGLNRMIAGLVGPGDAALAFSFSGRTREVCELARHCKDGGAAVVSITNFPKSKLAKLSDVVLLTASDETAFRLGAMTSRIAQFLVTDFLIINLALKDVNRTEQNVLRTHKMIDSQH